MCSFSRRRGKLRPGAGKAVSRRRGKVSRALAGLILQRHSFATLMNFKVGVMLSWFFSAPKKVVSWRRESLLSGAGERSARRRLASLLGQKQKILSTSNIRSTSEERCVGFPGAGESCVLAPGKLFPGARERLARRRLV